MPTFTVYIPDDLKKRMDKRPDVNWAEYLKGRIELRVKQLRKFEEMVARGEI